MDRDTKLVAIETILGPNCPILTKAEILSNTNPIDNETINKIDNEIKE